MIGLAEDEFAVRLQVGRLLRGPLLAVAVLARNVVLVLVTFGFGGWDLDRLAPTWVVVYRRATLEEVGRLAGGRLAGDGERLFAEVEASLSALSVEEFLSEWELGTPA